MMNAECRIGSAFVAAVLALLGGCTSGGERQERTAAESPVYPPVYSPAERMEAKRDVRPAESGAGAAAGGLRTGVRCRVHLRRDAVGVAGQSPMPIVGASMLSDRASLAGTIESAERDALLVRTEGSVYWVPREMILAVEFPDEGRP